MMKPPDPQAEPGVLMVDVKLKRRVLEGIYRFTQNLNPEETAQWAELP